MRVSIVRGALLLGALTLAACAADGTAGDSSAGPVAVVSAPAQLALRLPGQAANLQRGATAPIQRPAEGVDVAYATTNRSAAGFVQVMRAEGLMPDGVTAPAVQADYQRWVAETTRGANAHRRLRVVTESNQPPTGALFRCAEMEGTYGRQPVLGMMCVGAAGGQLLRLRISMPRRDPPAADPRAFIRDITAALRASS
jgi:hypothetical protein